MHDKLPSSRSNVQTDGLTTELFASDKKEAVEDKHMSQFDWDSFEGPDVMFRLGLSWRETPLKHDENNFRQHLGMESSRSNYFQDAHELFLHYWNQIETFSIFASIFIIFHLSMNDISFFLWLLTKHKFPLLFGSPSLCQPRKGSANVIRISSLILISIYATCAWCGRATRGSHWFCHKSLSGKQSHRSRPTTALLNDVISFSKWRCRWWQSRWQSTADNSKP